MTGLRIVDDFVISSIDISKGDYNDLILSIVVLNSKTNETCFLQHDISAISNIYIMYSYLFFGNVIAMKLICDDEPDFSNNEHGLMYNIKTRELINY